MQQSCQLCQDCHLINYLEKNSWLLVKCQNCGLVQLGQQFDTKELSSLYDETFFARGKFNIDITTKLENTRRLKYLKKCGILSGSRLLEIGCGIGDFVFAAKKNYNISGFDVSSFAIDASKKLNPEIADQLIVGTIADVLYPDHFFDAVVLWDVIEHSQDFSSMIKFSRRKLKLGGKIILSTPNIGHLTAKLAGRHWSFLIPPLHVVFFDKTTIYRLLSSHQFQPIFWTTKGRWVSFQFFAFKVESILPKIFVYLIAKIAKTRFLSHIPIYIPTGDIQYVCGELINK